MTIAYLAFQHNTAPANEFKTWNDIRISDTDKALFTASSEETGWVISQSGPTSSFDGGADAVGTGDASWVDEASIMRDGHNTNHTDTWSKNQITGLDSSKTYNLGIVVSMPGGRETDVRVNGGVIISIPDSSGASTDIFTLIPDIVPSTGTIDFEYRSGDGSYAYVNAAYLEEVTPTPELTPTQPPQGGEVFSFSGSNYSAQPTGPMTFTQGTRTISRAVTISNWNAEDGSFTGVTNTALPGVPAAGASDTPALLYGEPVTISLPDPGA